MLCSCCLAGTKREVTTIYEIVQDAEGAAYAVPDYQFTCEWAAGGDGCAVRSDLTNVQQTLPINSCSLK